MGVGTLNLTGGQVTIASGSGTLTLASGSFAAGTLNIGTGTMPGLLSAAVVSAGSAAGGLRGRCTSFRRGCSGA